jgi:hypothetical protein
VAKAQRKPNPDNSAQRLRAKSRSVAGKTGKKGKTASGKNSGRTGKAMRLGVLLMMMVAIGFFGMLVIDLGGDVMSRMRVGSVSVAELWGKLSDRFFDRDVPTIPTAARPTPRPAPHASRATPPTPATQHPVQAAAPHARAPLPAPAVNDFHQHVPVRQDPHATQARQQLDALLGRL